MRPGRATAIARIERDKAPGRPCFLQVWAQTLGSEADFLAAPLQRGLSTIRFPAPAFCADVPCAIDSGVTWPRFGPLGERPELGGPWPPPSPGAHVADKATDTSQLFFQTQSEGGALRALVDAPGPVTPGEPFDISASVQSCRRGTDVCGNSAGDVLVYVFAVDAAWAAAETQAPFVPDFLGPAFPPVSGSIRDVGRIVTGFDFASQPRIERPIRFELPLATLLSPETERDLAQVRQPRHPHARCSKCFSACKALIYIDRATCPLHRPLRLVSQLVELNARLLAANPWAEPTLLLAPLDLLLLASAQPLHDAPSSEFPYSDPEYYESSSRADNPFDDIYYFPEEYTTTGLATFQEISDDFNYNEVAFATARSAVEQVCCGPLRLLEIACVHYAACPTL